MPQTATVRLTIVGTTISVTQDCPVVSHENGRLVVDTSGILREMSVYRVENEDETFAEEVVLWNKPARR